MRRLATLALGGVILAGAAPAQELPAGDAARGEPLVAKCRTCHGSDGISKLVVAPNIAGEPEAYLAAQILAFRHGLRSNEMMNIVVKDLTDQEIADLAAWYAAKKPVATLTAPAEGAPELCVACHGADGISVIEEAPHLAGDSEMYISEQLLAFRDGTRASDAMSGIAQELTDEDIRAVAKWYAAVRLQVE
jgi:cytochrome c553